MLDADVADPLLFGQLIEWRGEAISVVGVITPVAQQKMLLAVLSLADLTHLALDVLNNISAHLLDLIAASFPASAIPPRPTVRPPQFRTVSVSLALIPLYVRLLVFVDGLIGIDHFGII